MSRATWIAGAVVVVALLALGQRFLAARAPAASAKAPAPAASAPTAQALELSAGDLAIATRVPLAAHVAVSGGVRAASSAVVKAKVAGELKRLDVREGDRVAAGQLLGQIDTTEYDWRLRQSEDQARSAEAQLQITQRTLANNRALVEQGFISRTALESSDSSARGAEASLQAARAAAELARKSLADTQVRSPIAGHVAQRLAQPGERLSVDARIVEVVDLARLEVEAAFAPEDVVRLLVGQKATLQVDGLPQPLSARVARINPAAQTGTRAVLAYLELPREAAAMGLRQGLFARGTIEVQRAEALVVPVSAVRIDQARPYVLAVENGHAVARPVTLGARGDAAFASAKAEPAVAVTDGLQAGAVVLRGTVGTLREGTRLRLPAQAGAQTSAALAPAASASR